MARIALDKVVSYPETAPVVPMRQYRGPARTPYLALAVCLAVALCSAAATGYAAQDPVVQFSTINALSAGHYEGTWPYGKVRHYGDFGIGTLDGLDGETIMLDGQMFQSKADGTVLPVPKRALIPFATVTRFNPAISTSLAGVASAKELAAALDRLLPAGDCFCAVRVDAICDAVTVRNCPKQARPFRPLAEVTKEQAVFNLHNVAGTLVGFRYPAYIQGLNMSGYHFHFIAKDRRAGGHMLDCQFQKAAMQATVSQDFRLFLLPNEESKK